jgi:hypothetical protein
MEGIEVSADTLGRGKVLCRASSAFEDFVCEGLGLTLGLVGGWDVLHDEEMYLLEMYWRGEWKVADKNTYIEERAIQNTAHYDVGQILRIDDILRSAMQPPTCRGSHLEDYQVVIYCQ